MSEITQTLDATGLNCPLPILRTRKAIAAMERGQVLEVRATDPGSVKDIDAYCRQTGHTLIDTREAEGTFRFRIRKG